MRPKGQRRLIAAVRTPHNRAYFWTVYSLELRLEDGLHLQVSDIDSQRMMVHVRRGKGAKDRYVPLPSRNLTVLRQCWATHRHPEWLFPARSRDGQQPATVNQPMTRSIIQKAMSRVVQDLEFKKAISVHSLRHTFGVHRLTSWYRQGADVQNLLPKLSVYLGHTYLAATQIYSTMTPELLSEANARFECFAGKERPHD